MKYNIGSLVHVRERDWIVQPSSSEKLLILKPLGGTEEELTGVLASLEDIRSSTFDMPDPKNAGDFLSCKLLRDAMLLGVRNGVGPFRSFGHINVDPRPYQFVPLLMAMKMDPVRLLIADDVGIGKTIEAGMIARELIDRGEISRMTVLCPPHLAEQWQFELKDKFHIDAELVLSNTAAKLERDIGYDRSLFEMYPFTIVSLDYIKNERRRVEFIRTCPEMVIVDEVHTCTEDTGTKGSHQMRWEMLKELSRDKERHMIFLSATPHSGKEGNFRSLLVLLNEKFINLPLDLSGEHNRSYREELAGHFVQRRRADIQYYMRDIVKSINTASPFPERVTEDITWKMNTAYRDFFSEIIHWAKKAVKNYAVGSSDVKDRVRWWSALALLHTVSSSPAAARNSLLVRTGAVDLENDIDIDIAGRDTVMDTGEDDFLQTSDITPDAVLSTIKESGDRKWFLKMAGVADSLCGDNDPKLISLIPIVRKLLKEDFQPIIFCRYIGTAEYLESELKSRLGKEFIACEVRAVTGRITPEEREDRINELGQYPCRILIATDCLSEGVNLQQYFNAVIHYDLAWNPTRHEQREGRTDRYGQPKPVVRAITYYGSENPVDGIILKVLLRKHESIRKTLGISVPMPADGNALAGAIFESLLIKTEDNYEQVAMDFMLDETIELEKNWTRVAEQEKRSRAIFAQHGIQAKEVAEIWEQALNAIGSLQVLPFMYQLCLMHAVPSGYLAQDRLEVDFGSAQSKRLGLSDTVEINKNICIKTTLPVSNKEIHITRTHPIVESLAGYVFSDAFDPHPKLNAKRCGVSRTREVLKRTVIILCRARYLLQETKAKHTTKDMISEDIFACGWDGSGVEIRLLDESDVKTIFSFDPTGNVLPQEQIIHLQRAENEILEHANFIESIVTKRSEAFIQQHQSVRRSARMSGQTRLQVLHSSETLPVDIIGVFVLLPEV